jgi:hypothetical protein
MTLTREAKVRLVPVRMIACNWVSTELNCLTKSPLIVRPAPETSLPAQRRVLCTRQTVLKILRQFILEAHWL